MASTVTQYTGVEKFSGGSKWMMLSALLGVLGLVATTVGFFIDTQQALFSYLVAFVFWIGIALAALIMVAIFHAAGGKWMTVLRRAMESIAAVIPLFVLLFIPFLVFLALGKLDQVWIWMNHNPPGFTETQLHHLHHKAPYLNVPFFVVRMVIYFVVWIIALNVLRGTSLKQDLDGDLKHTVKMRRWGPGLLPFLGITVTFAAVDWMMTLEPFWFSTIYGAYYFAGSFVSAFGVLTLLTVYGRGKNDFGTYTTAQHHHNLGKLLLAFTAFWAYIAFSQFLLIWIANIPEETPFYATRIFGGWQGTGVFLIIGHFVIPFFVLLARTTKLVPSILAGISFWILFAHYVDIYWLIMPVLHPKGLSVSWLDFAAFIGVGGLSVAFGFWRARGHYSLPVKDPYLDYSLRYVQP